MKKTFLASLLLLATITSCTNDENIETVIPQQAEEQSRSIENLVAEDYLTIHFNDSTYNNVPTAYDENGNFVFLDEKFATIYTTLLVTKPRLSTFILAEGEIALYVDLETGLEDQDLTLIPGEEAAATSRLVGTSVAWVRLYDDKNYNDTNHRYDLSEFTQIVSYSSLKPISFNDKCSSLKMENNLPWNSTETMVLNGSTILKSNVTAVFIGYEHEYMGGNTVVCVAEPGTYRNYPSLPGFNDKLSSFDFKLAQHGQYTSSI